MQVRIFGLVFIFATAGLLSAAENAASPAGTAVDTSQPASKEAVGQASPDAKPSDTPRERNPRVIIFTAKDCERCDSELARLRKAGGDFQQMQARGWVIGDSPSGHIQIVDKDDVPDLVRQLKVSEFPTVACVSDGEIVRSFTSGCTTPLDMWTFGFLLKGTNERPPGSVPEAARVETTGHYPLRGNHWSVDQDWTPSRAKVVTHLRGPNHASRIAANWDIENWSYEELRSLHDNLHESEPGYVAGAYYSTSQPADPFRRTRKTLGH